MTYLQSFTDWVNAGNDPQDWPCNRRENKLLRWTMGISLCLMAVAFLFILFRGVIGG